MSTRIPNVAGSGVGFTIAALGAAVLLGVAAGTGGKWSLLGAATAVALPVLTYAALNRTRPALKEGLAGVELPMLLLLLAGLNLRARAASDLATNPVDAAGAYIILLTGLASLLALAALLSPGLRDPSEPLFSLPVLLYIAYVGVVFLGVIQSVFPGLTAYRGAALVAGVLAVTAAYHRAGGAALHRLESFLYWWATALVCSVWLGVLMSADGAVQRINSPLPFRVQGVFPGVTYDTFGTLGALIMFWSLGRVFVPRAEGGPPKWVSISIAGLGFFSIIAAQYRTGYVMVVVGTTLLLLLRGRKAFALLLVCAALAINLAGPAALDSAEPYVLRGQTAEQATRLSGRANWWQLAIPIWKESPIIGTGLRTGTRFLVLAAHGYGETGTIHGTWVEALVGTGAAGFLLLLLAISSAWVRALRQSLSLGGRIVPLLLLTLILLRGLTGSTIEDEGFMTWLFLVLAMGLRSRVEEAPSASSAPRPRAVPSGSQ